MIKLDSAFIWMQRAVLGTSHCDQVLINLKLICSFNSHLLESETSQFWEIRKNFNVLFESSNCVGMDAGMLLLKRCEVSRFTWAAIKALQHLSAETTRFDFGVHLQSSAPSEAHRPQLYHHFWQEELEEGLRSLKLHLTWLMPLPELFPWDAACPVLQGVGTTAPQPPWSNLSWIRASHNRHCRHSGSLWTSSFGSSTLLPTQVTALEEDSTDFTGVILTCTDFTDS